MDRAPRRVPEREVVHTDISHVRSNPRSTEQMSRIQALADALHRITIQTGHHRREEQQKPTPVDNKSGDRVVVSIRFPFVFLFEYRSKDRVYTLTRSARIPDNTLLQQIELKDYTGGDSVTVELPKHLRKPLNPHDLASVSRLQRQVSAVIDDAYQHRVDDRFPTVERFNRVTLAAHRFELSIVMYARYLSDITLDAANAFTERVFDAVWLPAAVNNFHARYPNPKHVAHAHEQAYVVADAVTLIPRALKYAFDLRRSGQATEQWFHLQWMPRHLLPTAGFDCEDGAAFVFHCLSALKLANHRMLDGYTPALLLCEIQATDPNEYGPHVAAALLDTHFVQACEASSVRRSVSTGGGENTLTTPRHQSYDKQAIIFESTNFTSGPWCSERDACRLQESEDFQFKTCPVINAFKSRLEAAVSSDIYSSIIDVMQFHVGVGEVVKQDKLRGVYAFVTRDNHFILFNRLTTTSTSSYISVDTLLQYKVDLTQREHGIVACPILGTTQPSTWHGVLPVNRLPKPPSSTTSRTTTTRPAVNTVRLFFRAREFDQYQQVILKCAKASVDQIQRIPLCEGGVELVCIDAQQ